VAVIRHGPSPAQAQALIDYLTSPKTLEKLVRPAL